RAPAIRLAAVQVSGSPRPVSGTGTTELDLGELPHSANVSFEFFGLGLAGEPLLYEHLLEGLGRGWSPGRRERTVQYDHLADGTYRFLVRAVAEGGETSPVARVSFRIRPPFYRRWWFLAGTAFLLVGAGYAVEAVRWRQRRALDDVRARLAKDLHDDLGASLSRLSILSEVAARRERDGASSRDIIETIGEVSRSVVERLADGIWAVDPRRDDLGSLGERLRLQAAEVLDPLGVSWRIEIPPGAAEVPLHPERRRHVYLLFKEALTNAARHSAARHLVLGVSVVEGDLSFTLHDDGRGFDTGLTSGERRLVGGNGLANMKTRAEALGGKLLVTSAPGKGTRITLKIPLTGA
ncbi:MAG: hypothetical protein JNK60_11880, partial [Acidobacteria bacterium]|nr:hypothetical protein [Acidobacteriota bacterium]